MNRRRLLIFSLIVCGIPAFMLTLFALLSVREAITDQYLTPLDKSRSALYQQLVQKRLLAEQKVIEITSNSSILQALEDQDQVVLQRKLRSGTEPNIISLIDDTGTFVHPPSGATLADQWSLIQAADRNDTVIPEVLGISSKLMHEDRLIGAVGVGFSVDEQLLNTLRLFDSAVVFTDDEEVIASTSQISETGSGAANRIGILDPSSVSINNKRYFSKNIDLEQLGFSKGLQTYVISEQPWIMQMFSPLMLGIACFLSAGLMTLFVFVLFTKVIENATHNELRKLLAQCYADKDNLNDDPQPIFKRPGSKVMRKVMVVLPCAIAVVLLFVPQHAGAPIKKTFIYYVPHQDDETLSMSVDISKRTISGDKVIVVLYASGAGSGVFEMLNGVTPSSWWNGFHDPESEGYSKLSSKGFVEARNKEMACALMSLGVPPQNLHTRALDLNGKLEMDEMRALIKQYEEKYPGAYHSALSFYEEMDEHSVAGETLRAMLQTGDVSHARFFVSRGAYSKIPGKTMKAGQKQEHMIEKATDCYRQWDPSLGSYAIGYQSVQSQFEALRFDKENVWHGVNW